MGSEQSPTILHVNDNLQKNLELEKYSLTQRRKYVEARINAEQNIVYRRFQKKIRWSQMQHARSIGDTTLLQKLRNESSEQSKEKSYKNVIERRASVMLATGDLGPVEMRPWTASAVSKGRRATIVPRSRRAATAPDRTHNHDESDVESIHDDERRPESGFHEAAAAMVTEQVKSKRSARRASHSPKKEYKSLMQYGSEEPTLLEIHKDIVEKKRYPCKILELRDNLEPLLASETENREDYNVVMIRSFAASNYRRPGFERFDTTFTPEEERGRCEGNLYAPNFTLKTLDGIKWRKNNSRNSIRPISAYI